MCAVCAKGYPGVMELLLPLIGIAIAVLLVRLEMLIRRAAQRERV
ncbi:MAG: hypothetical protein ACMXYM_04755 [Candidatus Woesearchaeota archaeon]